MNEESKLIELFKKYPGIAARIRRSFAYHYDQIQREIEAEVATINKKRRCCNHYRLYYRIHGGIHGLA